MGFTELLTIIFIVLKAVGVVDWSWWLVFMPEILAVVVYVLATICVYFGWRKTERDFWRDHR